MILRFFVILRAKPEGSLANSLSCHPERSEGSHANPPFLSSWTQWRILCQLAEGFFANAQNDDKKIKNQRSKIKKINNNSKLKSQNSKPQLKTLKLSACHPERSEGSRAQQVRDSSLTLRMNKSKLKVQNSKPQLKTLKLICCHPERSEGSHAKQVRDSSLTLRMTRKNCSEWQ